METVLLGVTIVSLIVALVMSLTAWRMMRDEKRRSAARVSALSIAAFGDGSTQDAGGHARAAEGHERRAAPRAPWTPAPVMAESAPQTAADATFLPEIPLNTPRTEAAASSHSSGFLGASSGQPEASGGRQRSLAVAASVLLVGLLGGLVWMMSGPRGTSAAAVGPNSPLELVSLRHERQQEKIAVSGLVRNPATGQPVDRLSAVVFLFDKQGAFVTSARANVDFLKLGIGDESPFVVALDAPATVSRYRVSFRTDDGVVPHIDRRGEAPLATEGEQPISATLK